MTAEHLVKIMNSTLCVENLSQAAVFRWLYNNRTQ